MGLFSEVRTASMEMEVYAGIPTEEGHLDGPPQDSKFECPETILEGPLGQLVVAERGGPWLRLIDNQSVSTQQLLGHLQCSVRRDPSHVETSASLHGTFPDLPTLKRQLRLERLGK